MDTIKNFNLEEIYREKGKDFGFKEYPKVSYTKDSALSWIDNDIIMTIESNPEVMEICYNQGWAANKNYMTATEARKVTDIGNAFSAMMDMYGYGYGYGATESIVHFDEFQYFTNVTKIDEYAFAMNKDLVSITFPSSINEINGNNLFASCYSLENITFLSDNINITNMSSTFYECNRLTELDLSSFNTSNVTDMSSMFNSCESLTSLDLSSFNTSNVTNMNNMFNRCYDLTSLDLSSFNTSKVTSMSNMFNNCNSLTSLNLSSFDTSKVISMYDMFYNCNSLTSLNLSSFNTSNVTNLRSMFQNCQSLTSITFGYYADVSNVTSYGNMFYGLPSNGTLIYPCAYSDAWNNLLNKLSLSWTITCQASEVTNKIKFIENGVEITEGNVIVNNTTFTFNVDEQVWEGTYVAEQESYPIFLNNTEVGIIKHGRLQYIFIGNNNNNYFSITETISASSTSSSYDLIHGSYIQYIYAMFIDGEQVSISTTKTFSSIGEHTVQIMMDTSNVTSMGNMFYYCDYLTSINFGDNFDTSNVTHMGSMFGGCYRLTSLYLSSFNTSNVTSMVTMFGQCHKLTSIDFGDNFDTSKVTSMYRMFYECSGLTSLDLSSFNTFNVTDISDMFDKCKSLTYLDLSSFDISKVTDMSNMFYQCYNLTSLILNSFDTSNVTAMTFMFYECTNLTSLDLSHFDTSKVTSIYGMFFNCRSLTSITFGYYADVSKVTQYSTMFYNVLSTCELKLCSNTQTSWETLLNKVSPKPSNIVYRECTEPSLETN